MNRKQSDHQSRRHRLLGHDYETHGYYFITFATKNRRQLLGIIDGDFMVLSATGRAVEEMINGMPKDYGQVEIDAIAIMPDHVHMLLYIPIDRDPISISDIVRLIKGRTSAIFRSATGDRSGLWQKGFHDEIIRDDGHLDTVRRYIADNPTRWRLDEESRA